MLHPIKYPIKSLDLYFAPVRYNQSTLTVICVLTRLAGSVVEKKD